VAKFLSQVQKEGQVSVFDRAQGFKNYREEKGVEDRLVFINHYSALLSGLICIIVSSM